LNPAASYTVLGSREAEVLMFLRHNVPVSAIALHLGISPATVKTYIRQMISKLDLHDLSALRALAGPPPDFCRSAWRPSTDGATHA